MYDILVSKDNVDHLLINMKSVVPVTFRVGTGSESKNVSNDRDDHEKFTFYDILGVRYLWQSSASRTQNHR